MSVVTQDATSNKWKPRSAAEWTSLLSGTSIPNPSLLWNCEDLSGNLVDSIGSFTGNAASGTPTYQVSVTGWSAKAILVRAGVQDMFNVSGWADASSFAVGWLNYPTTNAVATSQSVMSFGAGFSHQAAVDTVASATKVSAITTGDTVTAGTASTQGVHLTMLQADKTLSAVTVQTDLETLSHATTNTDSWGAFAFGGNNSNYWTSAGVAAMMIAAWSGYESTSTSRATLADRLTNGPAISSIAISPTSATISTIGGTQALVATSTRVDTSTVVNTSSVTWASSSPGVATVNSAGVVTAVANGTTNITCTFTSLNATTATSNTVVITVSAGGATLVTISITPSTTLLPGGTQQLTATGNYSDSSLANITGSVTWASSAPGVAAISAGGLVTAVAPGLTNITATSGAIVGTLPVTVNSAIASPYGSIARLDHVSIALSRLCEQFKNKPNITALLTIFASRYNDLEAVFWAMLTLRNIAYATGDQLDQIGKIVGLQRNGLDDNTYRLYLYAKIAVNKSNGTTEDLIRVAVLMLTGTAASILVRNEGTATVRVLVKGVALTDSIGTVLADFEQQATLAGVRVITEWSSSLPAATFTLDIGPGLDSGHLASSSKG